MELPRLTRLAAVASLAAALLAAPAVAAAGTTTTTVPTQTLAPAKAQLREQQATDIFLGSAKVRSWLKRYPPFPVTQSSFADGYWTVDGWSC